MRNAQASQRRMDGRGGPVTGAGRPGSAAPSPKRPGCRQALLPQSIRVFIILLLYLLSGGISVALLWYISRSFLW